MQQTPFQGSQQIITTGPPQTNAMVALILSILAILGTFFYGIGICFAIPSLIIANSALQITSQFPNHPDEGMAKAAKIVSWIAIALFILFVVIVIIGGVLYVWASSLAAQG